VIYWHKQPTPYMVERCNAIADLGSLDLEVWFNVRHEPDRSWAVDESTWRFRARYIAERRTLGVTHRVPITELRAARPDVFVQEYDRAYLAAGFLVARAHAARTAFRVLPNFDRVSNRTWWRELSKHFLLRAVDGAKVGGPDGVRQAGRYGLPASRTWVTAQSIDVGLYSSARDVPETERRRLRAELGLRGCAFIYVGRLTWKKGVHVLADAYASARKAGLDVSLLLVGDGEDEERLRGRLADVPSVTFTGFVQKQDVPRYYAAADVAVLPTLGDANGLVVEEALAAGLPVICTDSVGEIGMRLPPEGPGVIVPTENSEALAAAMTELALDPERRSRLAACAFDRVAGMTPERHAYDFERFVTELVALPPRHTPAARLAHLAGRALARVERNNPGSPAVPKRSHGTR